MSGSRLDQLAIKRKNFLNDIDDMKTRMGRQERYPNPATTSSAAPGTPAEGLELDPTLDANLLDLALNVLSLDTQASGTVFAGPASGADAAPSFREFASTDLPDHTHAGSGQGGLITHAVTTGQTATDHQDQVTLDSDLDNNLLNISTQVLSLDTQASGKVFAGPASGANDVPLFRDLVDNDIPTTVVRTADWLQNGFPDASDVAMSWDSGAMTLTIQPSTGSDGSFDYFLGGTKYNETGSLSETITDTEGMWVIYIDAEGSMYSLNSPSHNEIDYVIENYCIVAYVYWDADNDDGRLMYEAHGSNMAPATHHWIHDNIGAVYKDGMALSDFSIDQSGDDNEDAQFSVAAGEFYDEDIEHTLSSVSALTGNEIWYLDGSDWRWATNAGFSILTTGTGRMAWNDGGTQEEVDNGDFALCHIFATNIVDDSGENPIYIAVQGQEEYNTKSAARAGADEEINNLTYGSLPLQEIVPVATIIFQSRTNYGNDVKSRTVTTDSGDNYVDWRSSSLKASGGAVSDHGALAGLEDDDHQLYLPADGSRPMTGDLDMGGYVLTNYAPQVSGSFFAGPASGVDTAPTFRAIVAGDIPSHTHSGVGQGGSLVIGTTGTNATPGSVLFAGAAGVIQEDNVGLFYDDANDRLAIGNSAPSEIFVVNDDLGAFGGVNAILGDTNASIAWRIGQASATHLIAGWLYNATAADASGLITTAGSDNALNVQTTGGETIFGAGQITMGNLGAGFVQADAGGVLSSAAIVAGDLPAHTHAGAGTGGALATGTTVLTGTQGSIPFIGAAGVIQEDNANLFWDNMNNALGIRSNNPHGSADALYVPWIAGDTNATAQFGSTNASNDQPAIEAYSYGSFGINAQSNSNYGVKAASSSSAAVWAESATGWGLYVNLTGAGTIADFNDGGVSVLTIQDGGQSDFAEYIRHLGDPDTSMRFQADRWTLDCGGVTMIDAVEAATDYLALHDGLNFIGDTANAKMTTGLTINQAANDDEIFSVKSSDVAHGMTTVTETDTWGRAQKRIGASGGLAFLGFTEATAALFLGGAGVTDDTTKSTAGGGYIELRAMKKSGTTVGLCGADANLVIIQNLTATRFIFDAEGTGHADVAWTTFSDARLKRDIEPSRYGLAEVLQLEPVTYKRTDGDRQLIGLLAQDVYDVVPEATRKPTTPDSYWSMDYNALVPVLVRSDQELHEKCQRYERALVGAGLLEV